MITTISGLPAEPLGLAAYPDQDPRCVRKAFQAGINYFFFYGIGHRHFIEALRPIVRKERDDAIIASGSGARKRATLLTVRRKILKALETDILDIFFAEYISEADDLDVIFGENSPLDELQRWKNQGIIRYVGATTHHRGLAQRLAEDPRIDVLMHRFNMAHRKYSA